MLDHWIRHRFAALNTHLEELYFAQMDRQDVRGVGADVRNSLLIEGQDLIANVLSENVLPEEFLDGMDLLGSVGQYMAACRRHGLTDPDQEAESPLVEASTLALRLSLSLGVSPRLTTAHMQFSNLATAGAPKRFTALPDEALFSDLNTQAQLAYMSAADQIRRIEALGLSHPASLQLLASAEAALLTVAEINQKLASELNVERFYFCVRPYFMTYRVGAISYRGANAGDFASVNELDLRLGLCGRDDLHYLNTIAEKMPYLLPEDRRLLERAIKGNSLLDELLGEIHGSTLNRRMRDVSVAFLRVLKIFGAVSAQHHNLLVKRFIEEATESIPEKYKARITASGPELRALLHDLERLRDLRMAKERSDAPSRYRDVLRLKQFVGIH
ncbi:MAG: DUF1864 family protein [Xanthomonadales bacterium]|nr:DUF1864 family protein [Xanthomonadales bacterium]